MSPFLGLLIAYLAGSIPAAYLAGRVTKGIDLRQHGSGNLGATNVYRVLGAKVAIAVLLFDAAKGAIPVFWLPRVANAGADAQSLTLWAIAYGVAAILGHVRPVFLLWKGGGKGVATAAGVFAALVPGAIVLSLVAWFVVLIVSGYMSLASLAGAVALPIAILTLVGPRSALFPVSLAVAAFVFWTHRSNIGRLRRGEEPRFGRRSTAPSPVAETEVPARRTRPETPPEPPAVTRR